MKKRETPIPLDKKECVRIAGGFSPDSGIRILKILLDSLLHPGKMRS